MRQVSEHAVALDDGGLEAQLGATYGGHIAAGAGADDGDVVFHGLDCLIVVIV